MTLAAPPPVKDVLSVNSSGQVLSRTAAHLFSKTQLLANDRDWDGDTSQLTITTLMLQANPMLVYRDIQSVLVMSATQVDAPNGTACNNGAWQVAA